MKLYGALASPYVARVAMVARLKGIALTMESAPGGMGSDEYKKINLTGKIPALDTGTAIIAESEVICEYLEDQFPEPACLPSDPLLRAHSRMISRMTDLHVAPHNTPLMRQRDPATRDQAVVDNGAREFAKAFSYVAHYMGPGPFAAGDAPSIGDLALAPFIIMLQQTVFNHYKEIPDPTLADPRIKKWWDAMQAHPECKAACDEYDEALSTFLVWMRKRMAARS